MLCRRSIDWNFSFKNSFRDLSATLRTLELMPALFRKRPSRDRQIWSVEE